MTDPHDPTHPLDAEPLHPLDELASAHLDGVADPIDVAAASGLTGFADRVAGFEEVRRQIRAETGPVDGARRESALAAALAAFDELAVIDAPRADAPTVAAAAAAATAAPVAAEAPTVVPIEVAAARRARPGRRWQLVGAAAAVAAGALALVPMLTRDSDEPTTTELAAEEQADADTLANDAARGTAEMTGGAGGAADMATSLATPKLGDFKDYDELAGAVRKELPPAPKVQAAPAAPTTTAAPRVTSSLPPNSGGDPAVMAAPATPGTACPPVPNEPTQETASSVVYGGEATVDGQPYEVRVTEDGTGNRTMTVRDPASCTVKDERPL